MSADADVRASIEQHSKSFALASRLLPADVGRDAAVLYAYCRRADDLIDDCIGPNQAHEQRERLKQLWAELDSIYAQDGADVTVTIHEPLLLHFQRVVKERDIPRVYLDELLQGMEMDAAHVRYQTMADLQLYAYRVAGTVGLMMCHIMGVREGRALRHAAHLGMGMQLTNIARDVHEDWLRGRMYIPAELLARCQVEPLVPPDTALVPVPLSKTAAAGVARATKALLECAETYYRSGDDGVRYLSTRCGLAIRAARLVYSEIGARIEAQGYDPLAPRAVVSGRRKLELVAQAAWSSASQWPWQLLAPRPTVPSHAVTQPETLFMVSG